MALNPGPIGTSIADYLIENKPAPGTQQTQAEIEAIWQGIMGLIYADIKANMVVLPAALGAGLPLTVPTAIPVEITAGPGSGSTGATIDPEEITGTGSVE